MLLARYLDCIIHGTLECLFNSTFFVLAVSNKVSVGEGGCSSMDANSVTYILNSARIRAIMWWNAGGQPTSSDMDLHSIHFATLIHCYSYI